MEQLKEMCELIVFAKLHQCKTKKEMVSELIRSYAKANDYKVNVATTVDMYRYFDQKISLYGIFSE